MVSSGRDVLRRTGGREGGLAMVLMANVGFRTGSLGVWVAVRAGMDCGTTIAGGGLALADLPPVSLRMKDEKEDPDLWGLGRVGTALVLLLLGIGTGWVTCGGGLILMALIVRLIREKTI